MIARVWIVLVMCLSPSLASAVYLNQAESLGYRQGPNGEAFITMRFTGNAGEPDVDIPYNVSGDSTFAKLQDWIDHIVKDLNKKRLAGTATQVQSGKIITGASLVDPPPTAQQIWQRKANLCRDFKGVFTGQLATDVNAVCAEAQSTYQAGFLNE